ncbi:hypothetical protein LCGC14_1983800 [marine sediment metagenome]|uniref:Uncharacterized protein n=1 Tax=marine sediment metagenome TaxID=412755 RepID=A0A0F9FW87_9ZZZZ
MSFDLIKTVGDIVEKSGQKALEIFGLSVIAALILLFGDRFIGLAVIAMEAGLEFVLSILAAV